MKYIYILLLFLLSCGKSTAQSIQVIGKSNNIVKVLGGLTADSLFYPPFYPNLPSSGYSIKECSIIRSLLNGDTVIYYRENGQWLTLNPNGTYLKQGGDAFGTSLITGTTDTRNWYLKTNDSGRIRIDSFGRIKMGEVDKYRVVIDTAPGIIPPVWDTTDKGNKWDFEWMKTKGFLSVVYNNTDSMGAITIALDNDCLEGGTGPRLRTWGRGSTGYIWNGAMPLGRGSGNVAGGLSELTVNGWVNLAIGPSGNNYSGVYIGGADEEKNILLITSNGQGYIQWTQTKGTVGVKYKYGESIPADFSVRGNTVDSGKLIVTETPYLPDSNVYHVVLAKDTATGLFGSTNIVVTATGNVQVTDTLSVNGKVGIGTNTPSADLHLTNSSASILEKATSNAGLASMSIDNDNNRGLRLFSYGTSFSGTTFGGELNLSGIGFIGANAVNALAIGPTGSNNVPVIIGGPSGILGYFDVVNNKMGIDTVVGASHDKLTVNGTGTFIGRLRAPFYNISSTTTPSGTADSQGATGDMIYDDNFLYIKTSAGWKRSALSTF